MASGKATLSRRFASKTVAVIVAVVISGGLRVGHGVGQFEVAHDRASPWRQERGRETRSAVRVADGETRKPPEETICVGRIDLRSAVDPLT